MPAARLLLTGLALASLLALPAAQAAGPPSARAVQNGRLACEGVRDGNSDVYTVNPDGTRLTWLTDHEDRDGDPSWSRDGRRLAFESVRELGSEVYTMSADGRGVRMVTRNGSAEDRSTSWSPDGRRIVFHSGRDGNFEVYSMRSDGTDQRNLTNNDASDALPVLSPDGKRIAFNSDREGGTAVTPDLFVMDVDGGNVRRVTTLPAQDAGASWSPDGQQLAFHSGAPAVPGGLEIYRIHLDGSGLTRLTPLGDDDFTAFPVWSPDGKRIAWTGNQDADFEVYTMDAADGGNVQRVTKQPGFDGRCDWDRRR